MTAEHSAARPKIERWRRQLVDAVNSGDLDAAATLVVIPTGPEIASLEIHRISHWKGSSDQAVETTAGEIYAVLAGRWVDACLHVSVQERARVMGSTWLPIVPRGVRCPFVLEHMLRHDADGGGQRALWMKRRLVSLARATARRCEDAYRRACLDLLAARHTHPKPRESLHAYGQECRRLADVFSGYGDHIGHAEALACLAGALMRSAESDDDVGQVLAMQQRVARLFDGIRRAQSLEIAGAIANGGSLSGLVDAPAAQELARVAGEAYETAGCSAGAARMRNVGEIKVPANSLVGTALSLSFLALAWWANGQEAVFFVLILAGGAALAVHEAGHWAAAAVALGIPITRVQVGLGAGLGFRVGNTHVRLGVLPLVGFVAQQRTTQEVYDYRVACRRAARAGQRQPELPDFSYREEARPWSDFLPRGQRAVVYGAGILANCLAALVLWGALAWSAPGSLVGIALHFLLVAQLIVIVINSMPVPPTDGCKVLCTGLECMLRRDMSKGVRTAIAYAGGAAMCIWVAVNGWFFLADVFGKMLP